MTFREETRFSHFSWFYHILTKKYLNYHWFYKQKSLGARKERILVSLGENPRISWFPVKCGKLLNYRKSLKVAPFWPHPGNTSITKRFYRYFRVFQVKCHFLGKRWNINDFSEFYEIWWNLVKFCYFHEI